MKKVSFSTVIRKEGVNPYVDPPLGTGSKLGRDKGVISVRVFLEGKCFKANLMPLGPKRTKADPGQRHRLYLNGLMRKAVGKDHRDEITVVLQLDLVPRVEPMNPALLKALNREPKAKKVFEGLSVSRQKELKRYLNHLRSPDAIQRNVSKVMDYLRKPQALWFGKKKSVEA
jgi:Bacteriocin-protection, YdeI or OmpD-Associated